MLSIIETDSIIETASCAPRAEQTGAEIWGPAGEKADFPIKCTKWLSEGKNIINGLYVYSLNCSKTDGELAFIVEENISITGDLIRAHAGGRLCILPDAKLKNAEKASVKKLISTKDIHAILPRDGWPIFRHGEEALSELIASI